MVQPTRHIRRSLAAIAAATTLTVITACASDVTATPPSTTPVPTRVLASETVAASQPQDTTTTETRPPATEAPTTTDGLLRFATQRADIALVPMINIGDPPPAPTGSESFELDFNGHTIRGIEIPGAEPAVVLLHGFPDNLHLYDELYPLLAGRRRVIAFDFIGWGRSDKPIPGEFDYTMKAQELQVEAVLDARLAGAPASVVLHDASGIPGFDLALRRPELFERLIVLNTFYGLAPTQTPPTAITLYSNPGLQGVEDAINLSPEALEDLYRWQIAEFLQVPNEQAVVDRLWSQFPEALPAFIAMNDDLFPQVGGHTSRFGELAGLKMPVSIVFGAKDINLTPDVGRFIAEKIPGSDLTIVEDAGHFVQIDRPDVVAATILGG